MNHSKSDLNTVIKSLARKKNRSPRENITLANARLDYAQLAGITVSDCDLDLLSSYTWRIDNSGNAVTKVRKKNRYLGKLIMARILGRDVDQQVSRTAEAFSVCDYRREVLQISAAGNNYSTEISKVKKFEVPTEFKGLLWNANEQRWVAQIVTNNAKRLTKTFFSKDPHFAYYVLCMCYEEKITIQNSVHDKDEQYLRKDEWEDLYRGVYSYCVSSWDRMLIGPQDRIDDRARIGEFIVPKSIQDKLIARGEAYSETQFTKNQKLERDLDVERQGDIPIADSSSIAKPDWSSIPFKPFSPGDDCTELDSCLCSYCRKFGN